MSDIASDVEDIIKRMKPWEPKKLTYTSDEVPDWEYLRSNSQALVYHFRELRDMWHTANKRVAELEKELMRFVRVFGHEYPAETRRAAQIIAKAKGR